MIQAKQQNYFLLLLIAVCIFFAYKVYENFIFNIVIAVLFVYGTINIHKKLSDYVKYDFISSMILTIFISLMFFLPLIYFLNSFTDSAKIINKDYLIQVMKNIEQLGIIWAKDAGLKDADIAKYLSYIDINSAVAKIIEISSAIGKIGVNFVKDVSVIMVFYFVILLFYKKISFYMCNIVPLERKDQREISTRLSDTMSVVFISTMLTSFLEGFLFLLIMQFYGYDGLFFGILYAFASLVPIVGGVVMWLPIMLYEISIGNLYDGLMIALYTIIVISIIADTFIKPIIIKYIQKTKENTAKQDIHSLLIFFSVLAGMSSYGFWGIIIGPAVTVILITLIHIYTLYNEDNNHE